MADRTYNKIKIDGVVKLDLSGDTVTADKLLKNTTAHNHLGAAITGTYEPPTFTTQTKSATPTESAQEITPDSGYNGLSKVTVNAISPTYVGSGVTKQAAKTVAPTTSEQTAVASGVYTTGAIKVGAIQTETKNITANGTYTPTSGKYYSSVSVAVPTTPTLQTKSATPSETAQDITPDSGYDGLSKVTVGAISSTYVGTGVSRQAAKTVTPNDSTQTAVASGKYTTGAVTVAAVPTETKSITTNGTHTPSSGKYFSSVTVDVSTTPNLQEKSAAPSETAQNITADAGYDGLSKVSVGAISSTYVGSGITKKAAATITPSEETQTIAAGQYLNGAQTISAISSTYVGSGIARKSASDLTASGATVSVPAGYYASNASKSIGTGALATPTINTSTGVVTASVGTAGYIATGTDTQKTLSLTTKAATTITPTTSSQTAVAKNVYTTGVITVGAIPSNYVDVSGATNVTAANMLSGTKAHNSSGTLISGSMTNVGKQEIKLTGTSATTITKGYHDGTGSASIDAGNITNLTSANIKKDVSILGVTGSYEGSGGGMNVQGYHGMVSIKTTSYSTTGVKLTVAKTGTYKVSWMGVRNTNSGTSGSQLYIGNSAYGSAQTSFTNTYAQSVTLTNVSLQAGQTVEVRARARSTSYYMMVGNLIIEQTA